MFARNRYDSWDDVLGDFLGWLARYHPDSKLIEGERRNLPGSPQTSVRLPGNPDYPLFGAPLRTPAMRYAPLNELGVIYLFGIMANDLGFAIEAIALGFPDCEAKRLTDPRRGVWRHVRIEFEFRSSGFRSHSAEADKCDLLVCWQHDWPGCPIDVLELKDLVT